MPHPAVSKIPGVLAGLAMLCAAGTVATALDVKPLRLDMVIGTDTYAVTAQPMSTWQVSSEGEISLDQKFDIQPDGSHGLIQVKLAPLPANAGSTQPNPCALLQGVAQSLKKEGLRVSAGRTPQANLAPVCTMVAEASLKTQFYYATLLKSGDIIVAGVARNGRDLNDAEITEFQRYLASIKATPKE